MSIFEDSESIKITDFLGSKSSLDAVDLSLGDALLARNCRFRSGKVYTREGFKNFSTEASANQPIGSLHHFKKGDETSLDNDYVAYLRRTAANDLLVLYKQTAGTYLTILTKAIASAALPYAAWASAGNRLYAALVQFDATYATGTGVGYVWDGNASNQMIACFQRPMLTTEVTEALTQPGAGEVTAGTHYVGVLFQTKAGYWTKPGPATSALVLSPQSIVSTGANNIRVTLTPATTWPAWISKVQVVMTPADNNFEYYVVAGTQTPITSGSATVYTIDVNISDLHLTSTGSQGAGTLADDYFGLLSMDSANAAPFNVKYILPWGQRMVWVGQYGGIDTIFVSDQLNAEWISADQHLLQLPGQRPIGSAFVSDGILYAVSSAGGIYGFSDNGGRPVTFSPPVTVDGTVSVRGPFCTSVSASGGMALILSPQGLYIFSGGSLSDRPLSYFQSVEWDNILWTSPYVYRYAAVDYSQERMIVAAVTSLTGVGRMLVWSYDEGLRLDKAKFSEWTNPSSALGFFPNTPGPGLAVVGRSDGIWQLIVVANQTYAGSTYAAMMRLQLIKAGDTLAELYKDYLEVEYLATGIDWKYQTCLLPPIGVGEMLNHVGFRLRCMSLNGTASIYMSAKSVDNVRTITIPASPMEVAASPGKIYEATFDATEEMVSLLFTNNAIVSTGFSIAALAHYFNFLSESR